MAFVFWHLHGKPGHSFRRADPGGYVFTSSPDRKKAVQRRSTGPAHRFPHPRLDRSGRRFILHPRCPQPRRNIRQLHPHRWQSHASRRRRNQSRHVQDDFHDSDELPDGAIVFNIAENGTNPDFADPGILIACEACGAPMWVPATMAGAFGRCAICAGAITGPGRAGVGNSPAADSQRFHRGYARDYPAGGAWRRRAAHRSAGR